MVRVRITTAASHEAAPLAGRFDTLRRMRKTRVTKPTLSLRD
jgi:hypothetical protein